MLACRLLGHRYRFFADGRTMTWACLRCGTANTKTYETPAEASRYARSFDREDRRELGRRAPLVALFPLRVWRAWRQRHRGIP